MKYILILLFFTSFNLNAQKRNYIWCFGDSAGIDFTNISNPIPIISANESRGTCASICDTSGKPLFYAYAPHVSLWQSGYLRLGVIKSKNDSIMANGDSLIGDAWYHEMIIIPMPGNDSLFYLFTVGVSLAPDYGLWYSIININANGGLGEVLLKNMQLQNFPMVDCLTAIKHGNGRDWWLVFRRWYQNVQPTNEFFTYLISHVGITNFNIQMVGATHQANSGQLTLSHDGNKLLFTNLSDLIEIMDFDRCTGILSNPVIIQPANPPQSVHYTWSSAFSPNDSVLYISAIKDTSYLYQFDLTAPNILASRITLDTLYLPPVSGGALKLALDGKIYFSCAYDNGVQFNYPYADSMYNNVNMYLSVINNPNNLGTACNYASFSFCLGGKRTYYGLPNNPDYDMPALTGSPCDTLTGIANIEQGISKAELFVTWVSDWQKLFVNAQHLKGKKVTVEVFDVAGKNLTGCCHAEVRGISQNSYFTKDIFLPNLAAGMYVVKLQTEKEMLAKKFVVE